MLISGKEKLERMRGGRAIYIGAERVDDVTRHLAFKNAAQTIAGLYDLNADPQQRELFSFEENGERYGLHWLRCRSRGLRAMARRLWLATTHRSPRLTFYSGDLILAARTSSLHRRVSPCRKSVNSSGVLPRACDPSAAS
jgi:hypothetical protein